MLKKAQFIGKIISLVIKFAPIIMTVVKALEMVQTDLKRLKEEKDVE
jgi:hypothetical protein